MRTVEQPPVRTTEADFRTYLDKKLGAAAHEYGGTNARASYKILFGGDLNSDAIADYIIYNDTAGFCGSGGCSSEVYVGEPDGRFQQLGAPDLFGAGLILVSGQHGAWKDIVSVEAGGQSSFANYTRLIYDPTAAGYKAIRSEFCGGLDFNACKRPVILCEIDGIGLDVADGAPVFAAPVDKVTATAGAPDTDHFAVQAAPDEFHWITAATRDGSWFLVHYKFSGVRFARDQDVSGPRPHIPKECA